MTGCGWVGKTLKPIMNCFGAALRKEPHLVVYVTFEDQNFNIKIIKMKPKKNMKLYLFLKAKSQAKAYQHSCM